MNQVGEKDCEMNSCEQSQDVTLFDPPVVVTKGRPESLRKKYALEVAQKTKKVSSQKNKKVCSQKIQKAPSQKPKKQTENMKLNKKETSNFNDIQNFIKGILRALIMLMPPHLRFDESCFSSIPTISS
ncbi:hypothetical protein P3L10_012680 [Capsicum annuum]